jgi:excisionase family DNA binding protein
VTTEKPTLTVREVAELLGLHPQTIYTMVNERRFPVRPLQLAKRKILFSRTAIERLLETNR